jgi:O-antigen/teichoic acid export membrane protein
MKYLKEKTLRLVKFLKSKYLQNKALNQSFLGSLAVKVLVLTTKIALTITLTSTMGAESYGVYEYVYSWMMTLTIFSTSGINVFNTKEVANLKGKNKKNEIQSLAILSVKIVLFLSLCTIALFTLVNEIASGISKVNITKYFWYALPMIPVISVTRVLCGQVRGLGRAVRSLIPTSFVPVTSLLLVVMVITVSELTASIALLVKTISWVVGLVCVVVILYRVLPYNIRKKKGFESTNDTLVESLPFVITNSSRELNRRASVLLVGALSGSAQAGLLAISIRVSRLIVLITSTVNVKLGPTISEKYSRRDYDGLQDIITYAARLSAGFSFFALCILVVLGKNILGIFGAEFVKGYGQLVVISTGYFVSASIGHTDSIMNMTGNQRAQSYIVAFGLTLNIISCFIAIKVIGPVGASVALIVGLISWNIVSACLINKRLNINPTLASWRFAEVTK